MLRKRNVPHTLEAQSNTGCVVFVVLVHKNDSNKVLNKPIVRNNNNKENKKAGGKGRKKKEVLMIKQCALSLNS